MRTWIGGGRREDWEYIHARWDIWGWLAAGATKAHLLLMAVWTLCPVLLYVGDVSTGGSEEAGSRREAKAGRPKEMESDVHERSNHKKYC